MTGAERLTAVDYPVCDLKPWPENPRTITKDGLDRLKRSMEHDRQMLEARPLVALPDGTVIMGNQRLRAAVDLGWDLIPVAFADIDPARAREWALRDNETFGDWQHDQLTELLNAMHADGSDLHLLGFGDDHLAELLIGTNAGDSLLPNPADDPPGGDTDPNEPPEDPITQPGDVILLGEHVLVCGDSHQPHILDLAYPDPLKVGAVVTDPPYGMNLNTNFSSMQTAKSLGPSGSYRPVHGDNEPFDPSLLIATFAHVGEQFWFGADYYRRRLSESDLDGSWLVWDKRTEATDAGFGSGFELIWSRQRHKRDLLRHLHFGAFGAEGRDRVHPTQKPVTLLEEILTRWTKPGDLIADPFAGSGSTLIACENLGRQAAIIELDAGYCDVIVDRWERHTSRTAQRPALEAAA